MVLCRGGIRGFWIIVSSCIFIAIRTFVLIVGAANVRGCKHHFSITRLFAIRTIQMIITIFISSLELVSHQSASTFSLISVSETPVSTISTGQSSLRVQHLGLYVESPSLEELDLWYVILPQSHKLRLARPIFLSL
jgi:hypothetical protein